VSWAGYCGSWGSSGAAPWYVTTDSDGGTASASYANVNACINTVAAAGEEVITEATGTVTWGSTLELTKETHLSGPGSSNLTIRSSDNPMILVEPTTPSGHPEIEVSGFTFDNQNARATVVLGYEGYSVDNSVVYRGVNIHENAFVGVTTKNSNNYYIEFTALGGVIWKNTFSGGWQSFVAHNENPGAPDLEVFDDYDAELGTVNALYIEDNIFTQTVSSDDYVQDCQFGGMRIVWRYNTFNIPSSDNNQSFLDWHEYSNDEYVSCQGYLFYGNEVNYTGNGSQYAALSARGGRGIVAFNSFDTTDDRMGIGWATGEYGCPPTYTDHQFVRNYAISNFRNRSTDDISGWAAQSGTSCDGISNYPAIDWNLFDYESSYDGTTGCGCGSIGSRPASADDRSGYFAISQGDCDDLTGYVGDIATRPSRSTIEGTLYVYDTDEWVEWWTPYTYPHPLRGEDAETPTATPATIQRATSGAPVIERSASGAAMQ
jgi:hypothetical protein